MGYSISDELYDLRRDCLTPDETCYHFGFIQWYLHCTLFAHRDANKLDIAKFELSISLSLSRCVCFNTHYMFTLYIYSHFWTHQRRYKYVTRSDTISRSCRLVLFNDKSRQCKVISLHIRRTRALQVFWIHTSYSGTKRYNAGYIISFVITLVRYRCFNCELQYTDWDWICAMMGL